MSSAGVATGAAAFAYMGAGAGVGAGVGAGAKALGCREEFRMETAGAPVFVERFTRKHTKKALATQPAHSVKNPAL